MLIALATAAISISPTVHPFCEEVGYELFAAVNAGQITNRDAVRAFRYCQLDYPPMSPTS